MSAVDQPGPVRDGEGLPMDRLLPWLRARIPGLEGLPRVGQFPDGASNLTYALDWPHRAMVLRRPPAGPLPRGAHDMAREVAVITALQAHFPYLPAILTQGDADGPLGVPFYVMERLEGIILRADGAQGLALDPTQASQICDSAFARLLELHCLDVGACGLEGLGRGGDYVHRQVRGWSKRYRAARTPDVPDFGQVMAWLAAHEPPDVATVVVHNDFRLDNVVLDPVEPRRVIGVLDWEMCTLGDPLMDLGGALAYWIEADDPVPMHRLRRQPSHLPGMRSRSELFARHCAGLAHGRGLVLADLLAHERFYRVFGLFRLAGILVQIYARHQAGRTADPRFAGFGEDIGVLHAACVRAMA